MTDITVSGKFDVYLSKEVKEKIMGLTKHYEKEIGGWLTGEIEGRTIRIDDVLIPEQEVSAGSVDIDPLGMVKLIKEYGKKTERICGHWHCVTGDTPIISSSGEMLTAQEIYTKYEMGEAVKLIGKDSSGKLKEVKVSSVKMELAPETFNITVLGREIQCTPNHLLYTPYGWVQVKNLEVGDLVAVPKSLELPIKLELPVGNYSSQMWSLYKSSKTKDIYFNKQKKTYLTIPKVMTSKLAELMGWLLTEGSINRKDTSALRLNITNNDVSSLGRCNYLLTSLFGIGACKITTSKNKKGSRDYISPQLVLNNTPICNFFKDMGFIEGKSEPKRIPPPIMIATETHKNEFIKAMIKGDGHIDQRGNNQLIRLYTKHKEMSSDYMYLLATLGIRGVCRKMKQSFFPEKAKSEFIYDIYYRSKVLAERKINRDENEVSFHEISHKEPMGAQDIFSITIPKEHNYIGGYGPIVNHNSHNSMSAFWSTVDTNNMKEIMEPPERKVFLFIVTGKCGDDYKVRVDVNAPHGIKIFFDELPIYTEPEVENEELINWCKDVVEKKVVVKTHAKKYSNSNTFGASWGLQGYGSSVFGSKGREDNVTYSYNKKVKTLVVTVRNKELNDELSAYMEERGLKFEAKEFPKTTQLTVHAMVEGGKELDITKEAAINIEEELKMIVEVFEEEINKMDLAEKVLREDVLAEEIGDYDPRTADIYPRERYTSRTPFG